MRASVQCVVVVIAVVAAPYACAASAETELSIEAVGERGAIVSYQDRSVTIDADGRGTLWVPELHVVESGFGGTIDRTVVDAQGRGVVLHVERAGRSTDLPPVCVPVYTDGGPIEGAELLLRRVVADDSCRVVNPSVTQYGRVVAGTYSSVGFDPLPCGPFR